MGGHGTWILILRKSGDLAENHFSGHTFSLISLRDRTSCAFATYTCFHQRPEIEKKERRHASILTPAPTRNILGAHSAVPHMHIAP